MGMRLSRAERRQQTHEELVTAAEACFVGRGFHATSVDEVAERAGYTKGAVYSNFASKEDLFFAVYQRRVEQVLTDVVPGLRQAGPERAFDWLATATIQRRDSDDGWLAVFFEFWAHVLRHPELRDRFAAIHASFLEPLTDAVRQLADDRGFALPSDVTATQVAVAWNAMEVGLGLGAADPAANRGRGARPAHGAAAAGRGLWRDPTLRRQRRNPAGSEDPMNSTQVRYHRRRLADVAAAMRLARTQISREQQPRAQLAQHQQRRLETVVRHAAAHSPFYRRWLSRNRRAGQASHSTWRTCRYSAGPC